MSNVGKMAQVCSLLALLAALTACKGSGIRDQPEDMNVSPRSQGAYDPAYRDLENDPNDGKKQSSP